MCPGKKPLDLDPKLLKKGQVLVVKVPPFYDREYLYEISGAGGKLVRANLYHSPRVKKQWTFEDLEMLYANGMIRFAVESDLPKQASDKSDQISENNAESNQIDD